MGRGNGSGCRPEKEPMVGQRVLVVERNAKIGELISGHHPRRPARGAHRYRLAPPPAQTSQHRRLAAVVHLAHIEARPMDMYAKRSFLKKLDEILAQKEELTEPVEAILGGSK